MNQTILRGKEIATLFDLKKTRTYFRIKQIKTALKIERPGAYLFVGEVARYTQLSIQEILNIITIKK